MKKQIRQQGFLSPGCSWSWQHWHHLVLGCSGRCAGHVHSTAPPPDTSPGSGTAKPGCSAVWPRLGGLHPGPGGGGDKDEHLYFSGCYEA